MGGVGEEAGLLPSRESSVAGSFLYRHKEASFKESLEVRTEDLGGQNLWESGRRVVREGFPGDTLGSRLLTEVCVARGVD